MVALFQRLLRKPVPAIRAVNRSRCLQSNIEVSALYSEVKACVSILNEVKSNLHFIISQCPLSLGIWHYLWKALLLQIRNDALPNQVGCFDYLQHLVVIVP